MAVMNARGTVGAGDAAGAVDAAGGFGSAGPVDVLDVVDAVEAGYPKLKPALARSWRDLKTVQFGVTPAHAVVFGPLDVASGSFLGLVDGTRGMPRLREEARAMGLPEGQADRLVGRLAGAGLIEDGTAGGPAAQELRQRGALLERLEPELGSLSLLRGEPGAALRGLAARRAVRVRVRGGGRVGAVIAAVLSGAGVGQVEVMEGGLVEPQDVAPGGLPARSVGRRRGPALREAVSAAAPGPPPRAAEREGAGPPGGEPPLALVVVAPRDGLAGYAPDPSLAEEWITTGTPHLYAGVLEATGFVGPLVLPGGTACAGCMERDRVDRDRAWPRMLTQWRSARRRAAPSCDLGLAMAVAGLAAAQALAFLDGELPGCAGARWQTSLPGLEWRREAVTARPDCPCGAALGGEGVGASGPPGAQDTMTR